MWTILCFMSAQATQMASTSRCSEIPDSEEVDIPWKIQLQKSSPIVTKSRSPRITKTDTSSCTDLSSLQPAPLYKKGHNRSSSTSPRLTVRFRKKKTKKSNEARPKSLVVLNTSMGKDDQVLSLAEALNDKRVRVGFRIFLESEFSVENLDFWLAVEEYKKIVNSEIMKTKAREIYEEYISPGAQNQVNLDHYTRKVIVQQMNGNYVPCQDTFNASQRYVFNIMENDSYARFVTSKYYEICSSPGKRSPRRFFHDILYGSRSRDRSPKRKSVGNFSSNNNSVLNRERLFKSECDISACDGCLCAVSQNNPFSCGRHRRSRSSGSVNESTFCRFFSNVLLR